MSSVWTDEQSCVAGQVTPAFKEFKEMGTASTAPHSASSAASPTLATWYGAAQSVNVLIQGGPKSYRRQRSFTH